MPVIMYEHGLQTVRQTGIKSPFTQSQSPFFAMLNSGPATSWPFFFPRFLFPYDRAMGKKKTPVFRDGSKQSVNKDDGKIKAIRTWDDIEHDSEDECTYQR